MKLAAVLLAVSGDWLVQLGRRKAGLMLLVGALGTGVTVGAAGFRMLGDYGTHGERIADLEDWSGQHVDSVTLPSLVRLRAVEQRADTLFTEVVMIREMVYQIYCERWPSRCRAVPEGGGAGGGGP